LKLLLSLSFSYTFNVSKTHATPLRFVQQNDYEYTMNQDVVQGQIIEMQVINLTCP
jgi:hypothetical protein